MWILWVYYKSGTIGQIGGGHRVIWHLSYTFMRLLFITLQYLMCLFARAFIWIVTTIKRSFGILDDCRLSGKTKNGLRSHPCYFLVNGLLYCPRASLSVGEDKHGQWTPMWHAGFQKQVVIHHDRVANLTLVVLYQLYIVLRPKATHTLSDSHTGQAKNVYCLMKGNFPYTHYKSDSKSRGLGELLLDLPSYFVQGKHWLRKLEILLSDLWTFTWNLDSELENIKYWLLVIPYFELKLHQNDNFSQWWKTYSDPYSNSLKPGCSLSKSTEIANYTP